MQTLKLQQPWPAVGPSRSITAPDQSEAKSSNHILSIQKPVSCKISISRNGKARQYQHRKGLPSKKPWQLAGDLPPQWRGASNWTAARQCKAMLMAHRLQQRRCQNSAFLCLDREKNDKQYFGEENNTRVKWAVRINPAEDCPAFDVLWSKAFSSRYDPASGEGAGCSAPPSSLLMWSCLHAQQALSSL